MKTLSNTTCSHRGFIKPFWRSFATIFTSTLLIFGALGLTGQEAGRFRRSQLNPEPYELPQKGHTVISARCETGNFIIVNVQEGEFYEFSTCGISWDTRLVIREANRNGEVLASDDDGCGLPQGASSFVWKSTLSGKVHLCLEDGSYSEVSHSSTISITWQGTPEQTTSPAIETEELAFETRNHKPESLRAFKVIDSAPIEPEHSTPAAGILKETESVVDIVQDAYLDELTAEFSEGQVSLYWRTLAELNTTDFEVERSSDGIEFSRIGSVKATGNSDEPHQYWFNDFAPPFGKVRYRIVLPGEEESIDSKTVLVETGGNLEVMNVFPNPSSADFTLRINSAHERQLIVKVNDLAGRPVLTQYMHTSAGISQLVIPGHELTPGIYILDIREPGKAPLFRKEISKS